MIYQGKYATFEEFKEQFVRYDDESNDLIISAFLAGAETAIDNYITDPVTADMLPILRIATMLMAGNWDNDRNADKDKSIDDNYLPPAVRKLIYPYRKPTAV